MNSELEFWKSSAKRLEKLHADKCDEVVRLERLLKDRDELIAYLKNQLEHKQELFEHQLLNNVKRAIGFEDDTETPKA